MNLSPEDLLYDKNSFFLDVLKYVISKESILKIEENHFLCYTALDIHVPGIIPKDVSLQADVLSRVTFNVHWPETRAISEGSSYLFAITKHYLFRL